MAIVLGTSGWSSPPVLLAGRAGARLRGLRPRSNGRALLMRASSAHGIGMRESLWVIGLAPTGCVTSIRLLRPGRVVWLASAHWLLETSAAMAPPPMGARLTPSVPGALAESVT